jgi:hypothetical protein
MITATEIYAQARAREEECARLAAIAAQPTLRDMFAMQAMNARLIAGQAMGMELCNNAYYLADLMLKERSK